MAWNDPEAKQEANKYDNPIPSRTLILNTLEKLKTASHDELASHFGIEQVAQYDALGHRLKAMLRDVQIKQVSHHPVQFACIDKQDYLEGQIESHPKGFGFVILKDSPDLFLQEDEMRQVFHGDVVKVMPSQTDRRGRQYGKIIAVIKRQQQTFIGKLAKDDEGYIAELSAPNAHQPIALEAENVQAFNAKIGDAITVNIVDYPTSNEFATGNITHVLSHDTDRDIIIQSTLLDHDIPHQFDASVIEQANAYKEPDITSFAGSKRRDITDLPLVTIDGEDARDFDDAVYAHKRPGGGFRLLVAIADVSHYVTPNSALDAEAWERGTSVYFPQLVVPMLPEALSNGLCSLNPHVNRLCMVCDMTLSRLGRVTGYEFYPAIMHSQARLTYTQVASYLAQQASKPTENSSAQPQDIQQQTTNPETDISAITQNKTIQKSITVLNQLLTVMTKVRQDRHAMEFETTETYMMFNDDGSIDKILPRSRNDAHKLIEECMLLANVCAADFSLKHELPVLYRNHESPDNAKAERLKEYLAGFGIGFPIDNITQADYQRVIEATKDRPDVTSIHSMLLRSMMQAYYGPDNIGHFGLAYEKYAHFTSPIRRYPDLMLHRAIKAKVLGKTQPIDANTLNDAGEHLSMTERRAENASRGVESWLKCHYMQQHLGEDFTGVVTTVAEFGLFITLTELYVDGLVHISELGDDFFEYDKHNQALIGKDRGRVFALGDVVAVKVAGVNLEERKIDFKLIKLVTCAQIKPLNRAMNTANKKVSTTMTLNRGGASKKVTKTKNTKPKNTKTKTIKKKPTKKGVKKTTKKISKKGVKKTKGVTKSSQKKGKVSSRKKATKKKK